MSVMMWCWKAQTITATKFHSLEESRHVGNAQEEETLAPPFEGWSVKEFMDIF